MGREAVRRMMYLLKTQQPTQAPFKVLSQSEFVERESVFPCPESEGEAAEAADSSSPERWTEA